MAQEKKSSKKKAGNYLLYFDKTYQVVIFLGVTKLDEEVAVYQPNGIQADEDETEVDAKEVDKASGEKPQQSYLALTKLGMGKKSSNKDKTPGQQTEQIQKDKTVNGFGKGARKSITEMASATLMKAGLTKS